MHYAGIIFAFTALVSWGFGDFFIQKTTRLVGSWKALFYIGIAGLVGLFPFVRKELPLLDSPDLYLLGLLGVVVVFAALFDFEAMRQGKIAIIEPIIGLELPLTVGLSIVLGRESLSALQSALIAVVFVGIVLAITAHRANMRYHRMVFERGAILAGVAAVGMALTNFLVGVSSRGISPLMTIWFAHSLLAVVCGLYLFFKGHLGSLIADLKSHPKPIIAQSILDNVAWTAFAAATTYIPIAIATTISESYIALAVLLGLFVNHEKLKTHQIIGVVLAVAGVIILSYFSS